MPLHLGNDVVISTKQIVVVLNLNAAGQAQTKAWSSVAYPGSVRKLGEGPFRSAVIPARGEVYLSSLDVGTVVKRFRSAENTGALMGKPGVR